MGQTTPLPAELWNSLAGQAPTDVARRASVSVVVDGSYDVPVLNEVYRVDTCTRRISRIHPRPPIEPGLHLSLATVVYLAGAKEVEPVGEWVSPRELPGGDTFFTGFHAIPVAGLAERFGNAKTEFEEACQLLGGSTEPYADAAYSFRLFPRLPVAVLLWLADEEFPARISMLIDRTADQHLALDALLAGLSVVRDSLLAAAAEGAGPK